MGERTDYEYRDKYGWFKKEDVSPIYSEPFLEEFCKWWQENDAKEGFYYIGTALYFTYKGKKYYASWMHYDENFIKNAIEKLKELGAINIQINYGELD